MTHPPTIAQLRREARALVNDANMPVGLGAVLRLYALKLDAIADGERHNLPGGCGHLFESHGPHGCTLCSTCQFVPAREIARQEAAQKYRDALKEWRSRASDAMDRHQDRAMLEWFENARRILQDEGETRQDDGLTASEGHSSRPASTPVVEMACHDCVTDHDWPDNPVPFEATTCACGHMWTYLGNGLWTDDDQEVSTER